jgi:peptidyl-prolyl cis-trans isomerase A (cyclophilin A)
VTRPGRRLAYVRTAAVLVLAALTGGLATAQTAALLTPAALQQPAPPEFDVRFDTTAGAFVVRVTRRWAPLGADRFYALVTHGFYDGVRFFRVIPGFGVQFGINGDPAVSNAWRNQRLGVDPVRTSNRRMHVAFAMGGAPDTRTTQLFIHVGDNVKLDLLGFAPFGRVVHGQEVVTRLHAGYGEGAPIGEGPDQWRMQTEGNDYLQREFPKLDFIRTAAIAR